MNNGHNRPECISTGSQNGDQTSVGGHAQRQICIFAFFVWLLSRRSVNFCIHQWFPTCGSQTISELLFFYRCCHFYEMTVKMIWLLVDFFKIILTWHRRRSQIARITSIRLKNTGMYYGSYIDGRTVSFRICMNRLLPKIQYIFIIYFHQFYCRANRFKIFIKINLNWIYNAFMIFHDCQLCKEKFCVI